MKFIELINGVYVNPLYIESISQCVNRVHIRFLSREPVVLYMEDEEEASATAAEIVSELEECSAG